MSLSERQLVDFQILHGMRRQRRQIAHEDHVGPNCDNRDRTTTGLVRSSRSRCIGYSISPSPALRPLRSSKYSGHVMNLWKEAPTSSFTARALRALWRRQLPRLVRTLPKHATISLARQCYRSLSVFMAALVASAQWERSSTELRCPCYLQSV